MLYYYNIITHSMKLDSVINLLIVLPTSPSLKLGKVGK